MRKTIEELKVELSQNPLNNSFQLLSIQEQDACKGKSNYVFKTICQKGKFTPRKTSIPSWAIKYKLKQA